jgi:hypothetical protein
MAMTIVDLIETQAARLGEPETVFFGYYQAVDERRVDDPPEIHKAIEKVGSREMPWADARSALISLGSKRAPIVRVDTTNHTMRVGNEGYGWRVLDVERRPD